VLAGAPQQGTVRAVAWGPDPDGPAGSRRLAVGAPDMLRVHRVAVPGSMSGAPAGPLTATIDPEPVWDVTAHEGGLFRARWSEPDGSGRRLLATLSSSPGGGATVWDPAAGAEPVAHRAGSSGFPVSIAWERSPARRLALAGGGRLDVWRPDDGHVVRLPEAGPGASAWGLAWGLGNEGESLVAAGTETSTVEVWDADRRTLLGRLREERGNVWALGAVVHRGRALLASGRGDGTVSIWDLGSRALVGTLGSTSPGDGAGRVMSSTFAVDGAGRCLVAAARDVGAFVGDVDPGTLLPAFLGGEIVRALAWAVSPAGQPLLASCGSDAVARLWDVDTGRELARVELSGRLTDVDLAVEPGEGPDGWTALLATASDDGRARVHRVRVRGGRFAAPPATAPVTAEELEAGVVADAAVTGLLALGERGLWPPLGLVADVVTLTGPRPEAGRLNDARLLPLGAQPGFVRLRGLGWPAVARAAFAALLLADLDHAPALVPPASGALAEALAGALRGPRPAALAASAVAAVAEGARRLSEGDVALLRILGPGACASDPTLPLRLRGAAGLLPVLDPASLELLASGASWLPRERPGADQRVVGSVPAGAPVVTDVAQHGPPARILLTQLALPPAVFDHEARTGRLLYRAITHPQRPTPRPLTLVLDTTPATYGPVEVVLRLLAHLVTATLWQHGVHPALVTLDHPHTATPLTHPGHLAHLWTTRTLAAPADTLPDALATAAGLEQPTVVLTHHRSLDRRTGAFTLVTTHTPQAPPPHEPRDPRHHHVPPVPDAARVTGLVAALVTDPDTTR
jgi:WD40 repeat protein